MHFAKLRPYRVLLLSVHDGVRTVMCQCQEFDKHPVLKLTTNGMVVFLALSL